MALISSPSGAAAQDFIGTALRRRPRAAVSLYPVRVQGGGAAAEIATAIEDLNVWGGFDLIVLTRGGGSLSDLWAFNEEAVVRAVAASRIPTLAAIGHSTDLSLAELAADQRAITPTAAAEAVFRDQGQLAAHLERLENGLIKGAVGNLNERMRKLEALKRHLSRGLSYKYASNRDNMEGLINRLRRFEDRLGLAGQNLDDLTRRLAAAAGNLTESCRRRLDALLDNFRLLSPAGLLASRRKDWAGLTGGLQRAMSARVNDEARGLEFLRVRLSALSPEKVLARGYALVTREADGRLALRAGDQRVGDRLNIRLSQGRLSAEVKDMES